MNRSCYLALGQADNAAALGLPYRPQDSFILTANLLLRWGLLEQRKGGGFEITEAGRRARAANQSQRMAAA